MAAPQYSAQDYLQALQALLPRGRVWPRDPDATQTKVLSGLTPIYERQTIRCGQLLVDAFPVTTYELLPEWEETMGLPDPCSGPAPTVAARRAQVVARLKALGGQTPQYFVDFAAALGYTITITQYIPARAGIMRAGQPLNGTDWAHAWTVTSPTYTIHHAQAGIAVAGEPLAYWGDAVLTCELSTVKPAHTELLFASS
jgi:uncharacterized protein YmfQ (DUF2313 family)